MDDQQEWIKNATIEQLQIILHIVEMWNDEPQLLELLNKLITAKELLNSFQFSC